MDLNKELEGVIITDAEIKQINIEVNEKFNLYFEESEVKILKKIATPNFIYLFKNLSVIKFTKQGDLSIDSIYALMKPINKNLSKADINEPEVVLALLEKFLIIAFIKIDETDDLGAEEKHYTFRNILGSLKKMELAEGPDLDLIFPRGYLAIKEMLDKYKPEKKAGKKIRIKINQKLRYKLQKEINSVCPFCPNDDVEYFEVHHIDWNPANNELENLLLLCRICHAKIPDIISDGEVRIMKSKVSRLNLKIELFKISIDSKNCSWEKYEEIENAFYKTAEKKRLFPILQFHLINHLPKTIVLQSVELKVKHLYSGLSGLLEPKEVPKMTIQRLFIDVNKDHNVIDGFKSVQIPSEQAVIFQLELLEKCEEKKKFIVPNNRQILFFNFKFSSNITLQVPKILLNTKNENEGIELFVLV